MTGTTGTRRRSHARRKVDRAVLDEKEHGSSADAGTSFSGSPITPEAAALATEDDGLRIIKRGLGNGSQVASPVVPQFQKMADPVKRQAISSTQRQTTASASASSTAVPKTADGPPWTIIGAGAGGGVLLVLIIGIVWWKKRSGRAKKNQPVRLASNSSSSTTRLAAPPTPLTPNYPGSPGPNAEKSLLSPGPSTPTTPMVIVLPSQVHKWKGFSKQEIDQIRKSGEENRARIREANAASRPPVQSQPHPHPSPQARRGPPPHQPPPLIIHDPNRVPDPRDRGLSPFQPNGPPRSPMGQPHGGPNQGPPRSPMGPPYGGPNHGPPRSPMGQSHGRPMGPPQGGWNHPQGGGQHGGPHGGPDPSWNQPPPNPFEDGQPHPRGLPSPRESEKASERPKMNEWAQLPTTQPQPTGDDHSDDAFASAFSAMTTPHAHVEPKPAPPPEPAKRTSLATKRQTRMSRAGIPSYYEREHSYNLAQDEEFYAQYADGDVGLAYGGDEPSPEPGRASYPPITGPNQEPSLPAIAEDDAQSEESRYEYEVGQAQRRW